MEKLQKKLASFLQIAAAVDCSCLNRFFCTASVGYGGISYYCN